MAKQESLKKKLDMFLNEKFENLRLEEALGDRFGRYSKYIIQERAIPDVRDGLKPVQRRILYGMNALHVTSNAPYKKSARIVGEVMGKYHPHGDSSIYEALVRMSQQWKMSVPLIDMHGNNGSIDGDGAAAMRYTETRLSKNAEYLLQDIEKNTVPFIPNFDDEEVEPTVLPAKFPNLLVNGAMGISSGYATYIPTHNINEVVNATIARIENPDMNVDDLLKIMPGPDFPTGGIVQGKEKIREAFLTGSGSVIVRSKYHIEEMSNDGQKRIVIDEIPYDTLKSHTVARMEQLRMDGKVPDVIEVRDESGRDGLRISIDLKKGANVDAILNYYFKNTDLQINCNYNMVVIANRRPMRLGVLPILDYYIDHQKEVVTNRTNFLLNKSEKRLIIVIGLLKMIDVVDEVIHTIRQSSNKQNAIDNLVAKFNFLPEQAEAIVMMRLYSLTNQDVEALLNEKKELEENIAEYNKILSSEKELLKVIKNELKEMNKSLPSPRRTQIEDEVSNLKIDESDLVSKEQTMVSITKEGYVKRASIKAYNASKTNGLKENDAVIYLKENSTLDTLLIFTNLGNFIYLPVYKIPEAKFKDVGSFISSIVSVQAGEKFVNVFTIKDFSDAYTVLLATKKGVMKQVLLSQFNVNRYTKAVRAMKISDDEVVSADIIKNPLEIVALTKDGECLRFRASEVSLYGTNAGGVKGINLKNHDELASAFYANKNDDIILFTNRNTVKRIKVEDVLLSKRSHSGVAIIKKVKSNPLIVVDAKKYSPNQAKEHVTVHLVYMNGNLDIDSAELKYNTADQGKQITIPADMDVKNPQMLFIDLPQKEDAPVSPDYLVEVKQDLFSQDFGIENETPIKSSIKQESIFDEINDILEKEKNKGNDQAKPKTDKSFKPSIDDKSDEDEDMTLFKKITLFDD